MLKPPLSLPMGSSRAQDRRHRITLLPHAVGTTACTLSAFANMYDAASLDAIGSTSPCSLILENQPITTRSSDGTGPRLDSGFCSSGVSRYSLSSC
ncbi:hypothetical protein M441DRAFT_240460 [Trichoderma asperellum CBS 433.97]|uniref:Uncharacterized protein n=1 Tax=Trichoderma asperellum (strain ATCC 204424 / CBS 433.97 / NBRC 101777) TaxID=1042311 RepID=A0A2T3Z229_TRIA4|nr:hypothetical protein M441DRAFT_240460 [Trichoderma asperellum CBS 433.97]PTB38869.1 hypothetical protein M441DRAFT_240460 [Trichoderma asperellum CBS 433.97]